MRGQLKFYRLSDATFYHCINTIHQFIKSFLDKKKMSIFEEYGVFKRSEGQIRRRHITALIYNFTFPETSILMFKDRLFPVGTSCSLVKNGTNRNNNLNRPDNTVFTLSGGTDRSEQTVQNQIGVYTGCHSPSSFRHIFW